MVTPLAFCCRMASSSAGGVLRLADPQNDGEDGVSAVQGADAALQAGIQAFKGFVAVLPALNRLMVRSAGGVGVDLPAVCPHFIVVLLADLLLHQPQSAHDVPPDGGFQRGMYPGFVINDPDPHVCQVFGGLPDGGVVVGGSGEDLLEGVVHALPVSVPKGLDVAVLSRFFRQKEEGRRNRIFFPKTFDRTDFLCYTNLRSYDLEMYPSG